MTDTTPEGHDPELTRWNTRFGASDYVFGKTPNAFLASQAHRLRPGMSALCIADGEGRNGVWLAQQGLAVTTFDFSPVGIAKSRALAQEAGVALDQRLSSVADWDWDARQYDVVAAIFVQFVGREARAAMFDGIVRALKPGGILILQGYGPRQLEYATGGPKHLENLYTPSLLANSFSQLDIAHLAEHDDIVDEGSGHRGMSALVDMVAMKRAG
jgi:cyclopropane fatty-acyl-phospholipid synthase-like methyltransferase